MSPAVKYGAAAVALIAAIVGWRWYANKYGIASRFDAVVEEWSGIDYPPSDASVKDGETPYRTGKVFVVHIGTGNPKQMGYNPGWIDRVWYALPSGIRATRPEEVDTLVMTVNAAMTDSTGTAVSLTLRVITTTKAAGIQVGVFDMKRKTQIGRTQFPCRGPNEYTDEVVYFIRNMPLKP